jgi:hypothetical protein
LRTFAGRDSSTRRLWVDAICINQQDLAERRAQVKRMRSIYEDSTATIVWLGKEADESRKATKLLHILNHTHKVKDFRVEETSAVVKYIPVEGTSTG